MARRVNKEQMIIKRQQEESARRVYVEESQRFDAIKKAANWENRTHEKIEHNTAESTFRTFKKMESEKLEIRRQRLAELLQQEELMYSQELELLKETPEQRRARMEERAVLLKTQRQEETRRFADEQLDRKWKEDCDAIRGVKSQAILNAVVTERKGQIEEKKVRSEAEREESRYFDELWEADRLKKVQREQEEYAKTQQRNAETTAFLDVQLKALTQRKEEEKLLEIEEARLMKIQRELEQQEADRAAAAQLEKETQRRLSLQQENETRARQRKERERREREEDAKAMEEMLKDEKYRDIHTMEKKTKWREEITGYMNYLAEMRRQEQELEKEIDRMRQEVLAEQYARIEEKWRQEKTARDRLMNEVYSMRQQQIQEKLTTTRKALEDNIKDRISIEQEVNRIKQKEEEIEASRRTGRVVTRQYQEEQMRVKDWEKKMDDYSSRVEYERRNQDEQNYTARVQQEMSSVQPTQSYGRKKINWTY